MPDAVPRVVKQAWGEEVAVALASWVDEWIQEHFTPGQALRPLDRARKRSWVQSAPSFFQETLGEEGVSELVDWLYARLEKRVSSRPEGESGDNDQGPTTNDQLSGR
jgi:hypothetical protein